MTVDDLVGFSELGLRKSHQIMNCPAIWWDHGCGLARCSDFPASRSDGEVDPHFCDGERTGRRVSLGDRGLCTAVVAGEARS
ncbi:MULTISPECIES: hypothetical protein [Pseudofrankia]|uniref:hypothetical protein n=1 Tax=Pseudofrankia TaxID=2994363 RepID=UPI001041C13D|nr:MULTISPECIES: hypothetical protein [Pseudofrankia]